MRVFTTVRHEHRVHVAGSIGGDMMVSDLMVCIPVGTSFCGSIENGVSIRFEKEPVGFVVSFEDLEEIVRMGREFRDNAPPRLKAEELYRLIISSAWYNEARSVALLRAPDSGVIEIIVDADESNMEAMHAELNSNLPDGWFASVSRESDLE